MMHTPIMLSQVCEGLAIKKDGIYLDATFGRGGHSRAILERLGSKGQLFAYDKDPEAVTHAASIEDDRFNIVQKSYVDMFEDMRILGYVNMIDGILMDLGVSSPQLDNAERGFSFMRNGPLDMRMDNSKGITAKQWLQQASEEEIVDALYSYGEEKFAKRIASMIVKHLAHDSIEDTHTLVNIIKLAVGSRYQKEKHPATRTFQALRIVVNSELDELKKTLSNLERLLAPGGRLVVISFHSLEHRIVRQFMQRYLPGNENQQDLLHSAKRVSFKKVAKVMTASALEQKMNSRARTAQCRVVEKI